MGFMAPARSARERRSRGDRTADAAGEAALEAYADALDRRAAQLDTGPPPARPRRDRPLAPPVVVTRGGVGADAGALQSLGAERLQCPPGVFRAVMDDVRDAVSRDDELPRAPPNARETFFSRLFASHLDFERFARRHGDDDDERPAPIDRARDARRDRATPRARQTRADRHRQGE